MPHPQTGPIFDPGDYAGFMRRTIAMAIDVLLLFVPWLIIAVICSGVILTQALMDYWRTLWNVIVLCWAAYMVGSRLLDGGSLGYRIMRIRYQCMVDGQVPLLRRLYRATLAFVFPWIFGLDHVWIMFDEHKQSWHDKMSGFYVVRRKARPIATVPVQQRVINFMGLMLFVWEPVEPSTLQAKSARE